MSGDPFDDFDEERAFTDSRVAHPECEQLVHRFAGEQRAERDLDHRARGLRRCVDNAERTFVSARDRH
jgi:hypothetical protein